MRDTPLANRQSPPSLPPFPLRRKLRSDALGEVWAVEGPEGLLILKRPRGRDAREQLRREAALLRRLQHPCLVRYHSADPDGWWLVTESVRGEAAHRWAASQPLHARIEMIARLVEAVGYLHQTGVVHGDIRPINVRVGGDGIPRFVSLGRSDPGFAGSPGYTAPEVLLGAPCSTASDVYALGATAYRLLTGQPTFQSDDPEALVQRPLDSLPLPPSLLTAMPGRLEAQVLRMLARRPEARPQSLAITARAILSSADDTVIAPLSGMVDARRALRRRLVSAFIDGQGSVVALVGPPGARREAVCAELLTAARHEQVTAVEAGAARDPRVLLLNLRRRPFALAIDLAHPEAQRICDTARGLAGLTILRAEQPPAWIPPEDHIHLSSPQHRLRRRLPGDLSGRQRGLLLAAGTEGKSVARLALRMGCSEAAIRALSGPLLLRGLLTEEQGGTRLRAQL